MNSNSNISIKLNGDIEEGLNINFSATYLTQNKDCEQVVFLAGVHSPRFKEIFYQTTSDSNGHYEIKIPLDSIKNGYCNWKIVNVSYEIKENRSQDMPFKRNLINFNESNTTNNTIKKSLSILCHFDKLEDMKCNPNFIDFDSSINTINQSVFNINFKRG
jgi:hypothetical protein